MAGLPIASLHISNPLARYLGRPRILQESLLSLAGCPTAFHSLLVPEHDIVFYK